MSGTPRWTYDDDDGSQDLKQKSSYILHRRAKLPYSLNASKFYCTAEMLNLAGVIDIAARTDSAAASKLFAKQMTQMARMDAVRTQGQPRLHIVVYSYT